MIKEKELKGLGGWLILVGIELIFCFIFIGYVTFSRLNAINFIDVWTQLLDPYSKMHTIHLGLFILGDMGLNCLLLLLNAYIIFLYFTKSYKFPNFFIIFSSSFIVFKLIQRCWYLFIVLPFEVKFEFSFIKDIVIAIIYTSIWIAYVLKSVRVKNTFVNGRRSEVTHSDIIS
ncbi:DUF2569 domain-containing protein [Gilliamella sp. Occ4-3]|uniref:DUF2569 domain-containing protein n=1 Tax=Gilliamella sp. Occ4-3 TaxID=3120254 RepID=UPI00080E7153|nr:DUF2569 domain-containing protein [Gilliamella apicola]OCG77596.1 hypothetical protein A9G44_00170 [Gilliamella apicola]